MDGCCACDGSPVRDGANKDGGYHSSEMTLEPAVYNILRELGGLVLVQVTTPMGSKRCTIVIFPVLTLSSPGQFKRDLC